MEKERVKVDIAGDVIPLLRDFPVRTVLKDLLKGRSV